MSQAGLLSEDEIRNYLCDTFGLKLDKDTFARPNKTTILSIYSAFLDRINPNWSKPRPNDKGEPNYKLTLFCLIKSLLKQYNIPFEFNYSDIIKPVRKRTVTFLNVLIYVSAQLDDLESIWERKSEERKHIQEEADMLKQKIEETRLKTEEIAVVNANLKPLEALQKELCTKREKFITLRKTVATLAEEAESSKATLNTEKEKAEALRTKIQTKMDWLEEAEKTLSALENLPAIKKELIEKEQLLKRKKDQIQRLREQQREWVQRRSNSDKNLARWTTLVDTLINDFATDCRAYKELKQTFAELEMREKKAKIELDSVAAEEAILMKKLTEVKLTSSNNRVKEKIRVEHLKHEIDQKIRDKNDLKLRYDTGINQLETTIKQWNKTEADWLAKADENREHCESLVTKSNNRLQKLEDMTEKYKKVLIPRIAQIVATQEKIESLMGSLDLNTHFNSLSIAGDRTQVPADATYIKNTS